MKKKTDAFSDFKQLCLDILAHSNNCDESRAAIAECTSVPQIVQVWKRYMDGILSEVPALVLDAFSRLYAKYKDEINLAEVYYNEPAARGIIFVGDMDKPLRVYGVGPSAPKVYVLGKAHVILLGTCQGYCNAEGAVLELLDSTSGTVKRGHGIVRNFARVVCSSSCECYNASMVTLSDGARVEDNGHRRIINL